MIACLSVNAAFVTRAWGDSKNADAISMLDDGGAAFTQALGLGVLGIFPPEETFEL